MNDDTQILGCVDGIIYVASQAINFLPYHSLRCGTKYIPFEKCSIPPPINLLKNSDLTDPLTQWQSSTGESAVRIGVDCSPDWTLHGGHTAYIAIPPAVTAQTIRYADPVRGPYIPVTPGQSYTAYGHFGAHRCSARFRVPFFDAQGKTVAHESALISNQYMGGTRITAYQPLAIHFTVPAAVTAVGYEIVLLEHTPDQPDTIDAYLFFTHSGLIPTHHSGMPRSTLRFEHSGPSHASGRQTAEWVFYQAPVDVESAAKVTSLDVCRLSGDRPDIVSTFRIDGHEDVTASILPFEGNAIPAIIRSYDNGLLLFTDGVLGASVPPPAAAGQERREYFILSDHLCDGAAHVLELRDNLGLRVFARDAQIFPRSLTPWAALQNSCAAPYPAHLAPAAAFRYRALQSQLEKFRSSVVQGSIEAEDLERLSQIPYLHNVLVDGFEQLQTFPPLNFPALASPTVSVIVPVHNKFAVTYYCLCALLLSANECTFEVIVVDDGSEDGTLNLPEIAPNVSYCRTEVAQGFVRACNLGATLARGEYVVFLNNDTEPTVGWLDELLFSFRHFDRVGLAGAKLLYPDGRLQEAGGIVWNSGNPWNYGRLGNPWDPRFSYTRQTDYLSGAAVMLPRAVWDEVGGFSDEFAPAYFEDTDLCFKVRNAGYKTYFVATSIVYHFEGVSCGTDVAASTGLKRYQEINRPKFKRKWANAVQNNGEEGDTPDLAKDRGVLGRVLFIDYQTPKPDRDAGGYAAVQEMRLVQSLGYKVTFAATNLAYMGRYDEALHRLGIETVYAPFCSSLESLLQKRGTEFDAVYIIRYYVAQEALDKVRQYAPRAKVLFNNCDLHFLRELRAALHTGSQEMLARAVSVRDEELQVMKKVDVVLSYNEVEHSVILSHNLTASKVARCPWVVEQEQGKTPPSYGARKGVAFLGGYAHPPNVQAVEYFIREIMPPLRSALPGVEFNVYGSGLPVSLRKLATEGVHMLGPVRTVDEVYDTNRVFVAPLLSGAGLKGKVLGALAHGIPCVLSPIAAESTGVRDGLECHIAETPEQWVRAIADLYNDPEAWQAMSKQASEFTERFYSFGRGRELMRSVFEAAGIFRTL